MEILFLILGVGVCGLGFYLTYDHIQYVRLAMETTGNVIGYKTSNGKKGGKIYKPVIKSYFGNFTSNYGSNRPGYEVGDQVEVLYIPGKEPRLKSKTPYFIGIFLMVFGGIFCLLFFTAFSFTIWHTVWSLIVLFLIGNSVRKKLKSKGIDTIDELKDKISSYQKKEQEKEGKNLLTDREEIRKVISKQKKSTKFVGPIFALAGIGVLALGIYLGVGRYHFLEEAVPATGIVVDMYESRSDDGYTYYPIVEYTPNGSYDLVTFRHDVGTNPPSYSKGETVEVLHIPDAPKDAIIDRGIFNWTTTIFVILLGLLFTSVGIGSSFAAFSKRKRLNRGYRVV